MTLDTRRAADGHDMESMREAGMSLNEARAARDRRPASTGVWPWVTLGVGLYLILGLLFWLLDW